MLPISCTNFARSDLPFCFQKTFQLGRGIEVIFDRILPSAGHDNDVVNSGGDAFLDHILDERLVDHRQHFLGLRFGRGQESRAQPRGGKDCFANAFWIFGHGLFSSL